MDKAIATWKTSHPNSNDTFTTTWMPFYLMPDAPRESIDKRTFYESRFGPERVAMMFDRLAGIGRDAGIAFKFGGRTGNTRDSHRLVQLGKTKSPAAQTRVVERLFAAYFEQEQDITSREVLVRAGVEAGLPEAEVRDWLASDKGGPQVDDEVRAAKAQFISGVPNFTINGRYSIAGAEEPASFLEVFEKIAGASAGSEGGAKINGGLTC